MLEVVSLVRESLLAPTLAGIPSRERTLAPACPVPLAFDFAWPVSKNENDDTQVFSFSFGWSF